MSLWGVVANVLESGIAEKQVRTPAVQLHLLSSTLDKGMNPLISLTMG